MQLTSKIPGQDEKLDGLLSLLMRESEDNSHHTRRSGIYDRYCEFFGEELIGLQEVLFEDGLIRCVVGPRGMVMEITQEGIRFMAKGGYSKEIREEMVSHEENLRAQKNNKFWNTVVTIAFVVALAFGFFIRHRSA